MDAFKIGCLATILALSTGARADNPWKWTPDRETGFYQRFTREPVRRPPPPGFSISIDGVVPDSVELYDAPDDYDYAPARDYRYTRQDNRVFVVDPVSRRVIRIFER